MKLTNILKKNIALVLFLIVASTVGALVSPKDAFAAYSSMPTELMPTYSNHLSTNTNDLSTGEGLASQSIRVAVYTDQTTNPVRVIFDGSSCSSYDRGQSRVSTYNNDNSTGSPSVSNTSDLTASGMCSSSGGDAVFYLEPKYFAASQKFGSGIRVALLTVHIADGVTRSPKISVLGNNRLSYVGYPNPGSNSKPNTSGELAYGPGLSRDGSRGTITFYFAPPCNFPATRANLYWRDADSGKDANGGEPVTFRIFDDTDSSNSMSSARDADDNSGVNGWGFTYRGKNKYHVSFYNVKGNAADSIANAIQIWFPFSSSGYYDDCPDPTPDTWRASWNSSTGIYVGSSRQGNTVGDLNDPDAPDAPQPGSSYRYEFNASNIGTIPISNAYYDRNCNQTNANGRNRCQTSPNRYWSPNRTQRYTSVPGITSGNNSNFNIAFDGSWPGFSGTYQFAGNTTAAGGAIYQPNWTVYTLNVTPAHGGTSQCANASLWPSYGTASYRQVIGNAPGGFKEISSWSIGGTASRVYAPQLCLRIPFYYNLTPNLTLTGGTTQQGDPITLAAANVSNPGQTGGRNHTNSEAGKQKGVVELVIPSGTAEPSAAQKAPNNNSNQLPCAYMQAKVGSSTCSTQGVTNASVPAAGRLDIAGAGRTDTSTLPVGSKLCYATYVQHPKNTESSDVGGAGDARWSYSTVICKVIVKAPKVQFNNSDVTVGRYRTTDTGCKASENAPIITVASPAVKSPSNLYGSWVEYGAFATGDITNFGSGAVPFGISSQPHRLTFGNNNFAIPANNLGGFIYGKNCLANPFGMVQDGNNTDLVALADDAVYNRSTGQLDITKLDPSKDKTGYVATNKNIVIGTPAAAGGGAPSGGGSTPTSVGMYKVKQCTKNSSSAPEGWASSRRGSSAVFTMSSGCNGANHGVEARMDNSGARNNGDYARWTFAAPANTSLNRIEANRRVDVGSAVPYADPFARMVTNLAKVEECFRFNSTCPPTQTGNVNFALNGASSLYIEATCQTNPTVRNTCDGGDRGTLYALGDITLTLNDSIQPAIGGVSGTLRDSGNTSNNRSLTYTATDQGSGIYKVRVIAKNISTGQEHVLSNEIADNNGGDCNDSAEAVALVPCKLSVTKTINVDTAAIADGSYEITLEVSDRANNIATQSWNVGVDNTQPIDPGYDGFKGRTIVIYAKKTEAGNCSATSSGNITINKDIVYRSDGYNDILEVPRIVFIADCNITIDRGVGEVNATLIAGDAIKTCDVRAETQDVCNKRLIVRGGVSANRLLLWRTYGADLTDDAAARFPAETFDLSPSQVVSGFSRGARSGAPTTVYEVDLPPRY